MSPVNMTALRPITIDVPVQSIDPGPAPMLQWISIADLVVDDSYQRDLKRENWRTIKQIADQFKWSRFSPVFVAPIEGGKYAVIDGQHRAHAAAMCGFTQVPCQVVQMTYQEQASSFAAVNGLVTAVTGFNIYKAALAAGEDWALRCQAACLDAGCRLMTSKGSSKGKNAGDIYAIQLVRGYVMTGHSESITLALSSVRRSEFGKEAESYSNDVLKPLFMAVCDRPWLAKNATDIASFLDRFDFYAAQDRAADFVKLKRRQGIAAAPKWDLIAADIGDALDKKFPPQLAAA